MNNTSNRKKTLRKITPKKLPAKTKTPAPRQKTPAPRTEPTTPIKDINLLSMEEITEQAKQVLPALDNAIEPPKDIIPNTGTKKLYIERYNKKIATLLLVEIATNSEDTINSIINSFGYEKNMIAKWRLLNQSFKDSYGLAVEYRQDILLQESIPARLDKLDTIIEDTELTPQDKNVRIQALNQRIKYTQWLAGKLNKRYAEQSSNSISNQITINAGANRAASYTEHEQGTKD